MFEESLTCSDTRVRSLPEKLGSAALLDPESFDAFLFFRYRAKPKQQDMRRQIKIEMAIPRRSVDGVRLVSIVLLLEGSSSAVKPKRAPTLPSCN